MSLQNRCHVPNARLKSAQATVGNMPTHPILSTAIRYSGHVVFPNAPSNMVRHAHAMLLAACLAVSAYAFAEAPDDPQSAPTSNSSTQPVAIDEDRPVNWKSLVPNIYHDQRAIWTFPAKLAHGEDWKPTVAFLAGLGALVALDPDDSPYFRNNPAFAGFNHRLSANNATLGTFLVPASFYALGWVRKDSYSTHTSLLAAEAVADCEITAWVLKNAFGRERPSAIPTGGNYSDTWFEHYQPPLLGGESFPSGHTIAAFSVATIFARRYGNHRWVPWVAYGAATAVGFSRITLQAHFPSDVFAGAVFGYVISRFVVLRGRDPGY
jgi:membrane-associated phospholipid phosphatase